MLIRSSGPIITVLIAVAINYSIINSVYYSTRKSQKCKCTVPTLSDHYAKLIAIQNKFEQLSNDGCTADKGMVNLFENHFSLLRLVLEQAYDVTEKSRKYCIIQAASGLLLCKGQHCSAPPKA
jgi:hypothetical protein